MACIELITGNKMFSFSKKSLGRMSGVDERLIDIAKLALSISPIDFGIPQYGGIRSELEQHDLFITGKSKCDGLKIKSYHQTGLALDFYAYIDGKASWKKEHLAIVACAFMQAANQLGHKLEWGGLWKSFQDMPHVQIKEAE